MCLEVATLRALTNNCWWIFFQRFWGIASSNCFYSPATARHFCVQSAKQKMWVCLSCFRLSWCKLTCISSSSKHSRLQLRAAEQQTDHYADFATGGDNLSAGLGQLGAGTSSAASTMCSLLISHLRVLVSQHLLRVSHCGCLN